MSSQNICWVNGSYYQRRQLIENIKSQLSNPTVYVFDDTNTPQQIVLKITSSSDGIFDVSQEVRLVILKEIPRFQSRSSNKLWIEAFESCDGNCFVVIDDVGTTYNPALYAHIKKNGKVFSYTQSVQKGDAVNLIQLKLQQFSKDASPEVALMLATRLQHHDKKGVLYDQVVAAVRQIAIYMGNDRKVQPHHISSTITKSTRFVIWQLFQALDRKDYCLAQQIINAVHVESFQQAANMMFTMCRWRYKMFLGIKSILQGRPINQRITDQVCQYFASYVKPDTKKPVYTQDNIRRQIQKKSYDAYSSSQLISILSFIQNAILFLRTGVNDVQPKLLCQILLMKVCGVVQGDDAQVLLNFAKNE